MTALHFAAVENHMEMVKLLLQHGADVNAKTEWVLCTFVQLLPRQLMTAAAVQVTRFYSDGTKVLHEAAAKNHMEMAKLLLQHGANVNAMTEWVLCTFVQLLQKQLTAAAAVQVTRFYSDGGTALYSAVNKNHLEMVKLLLQRGADVNAAYKWVSYV
jgi:ankyrin repeat protein